MPIGGFVITAVPEDMDEVLEYLATFDELDIHGHDEQGNVVVVMDCGTSEEMEKLVKQINGFDSVLAVGLTYFNAEDEVERMKRGEYVPPRSFGNKPPDTEQT